MQFKALNFDELTTTQLYEILKARETIFLLEQNIICQEIDGVDYISRHCFFEEDGQVVAYLRAFCEKGDSSTVHIGRVLTLQHGKGIGKKLMEQSIEDIKQYYKCKKICLNSQTHAIGFYEKLGFRVVSGEFFETDILHVAMELSF